MGKPLALRVTIAGLLVGLIAGGCVSTGVDSYDDFRSAIDSGATCAQLIDMRPNFDDRPNVQERIDADLEEIGCTDVDAERTDR